MEQIRYSRLVSIDKYLCGAFTGNDAIHTDRRKLRMIKVIASDLDGTLLNNDHEISKETLDAINLAKDNGIRFMISTGRSFKNTMEALKKHSLECDYIMASGAEIRDPKKKILKQVPMDQSVFEELYHRIKRFKVGVHFCSDICEYVIGTKEEVEEQLIEQTILFHRSGTRDEIIHSPEFREMCKKSKRINEIKELKQYPIYKIFISSDNEQLVKAIDEAIADIPGIASASSFSNNLELTHIEAQKGIALKEYITELGYTMEEVMALGDSMNDYSMLSMDFGVTVAMKNAMEEVKKAAKYMTLTNEENGVAYAIHKLLEGKIEELRVQK